MPISTPTSSRLSAVSASTLLKDHDDGQMITVSTGVKTVDDQLDGGLEKGKTTEIWGPKGSGKTALALTIVKKALAKQKTAIWASCSASISTTRVKIALPEKSLQSLRITTMPTLSHLITLIRHHNTMKLMADAEVLVIDDLNTLVDADYPRQTSFASSSEGDARKWQAGRRTMILASIVTSLHKLANLHNIAVLVTNGCATSMRSGLGAVLVPAIGGHEWDMGIWNRIAMFQDFNGRFIALQKMRGVMMPGRTSNPITGFHLHENGLIVEQTISQTTRSALIVQKEAKKRAYDEIADSDDEDEYGWDGLDDRDMLGSPPVSALV